MARKDLQVLLSHAVGISSFAIAQQLKMTHSGVREIIDRFNRFGFKSLLKEGRRAKLTKEQLLEAAYWLGDPRSIDYFYTLKDCNRIAQRIKKKWGVQVTAASLYANLRKLEKSFYQ